MKEITLAIKFFRNEEGDVMAVLKEHPGLSAFGPTPNEALKEVGLMIQNVAESFIEQGDTFSEFEGL
ncbi:MAG TPA: hypothetical protein VHU19_14360 [Pyrinomonadaceae bacterium]|jgi:predicted RNase H-like HicB family nuclease|nr:hypothetical protein [Pyrinomonadaceae bacterium]